MKNILVVIFIAGTLVSAAAWADGEDNFSIGTGFDYSSGNYGTDTTTTMLSIPVVGMYQTGLWIFKLTVPYVWISGDGSVIPGIGGAVPGQGAGASSGKGSKGSANTTQSGLGDAIAAVTYNAYSNIEEYLWAYLTGKVKFGTADTGLGTGENDYAAQVDAYQGFGRFTATGSLGYHVLGNPPGAELTNAVYGTLGGYYQFTGQTSGGAEMRLSQQLSESGTAPRELMAYLGHRFDKSLKISGYVLKGFSDGSPDSGIGMLISADL